MASIISRMRKTDVLRRKVLIDDLLSIQEFDMTLEEIIVIVFLDFTQQIKDDGNSLKVQKFILRHIKKCS